MQVRGGRDHADSTVNAQCEQIFIAGDDRLSTRDHRTLNDHVIIAVATNADERSGDSYP